MLPFMRVILSLLLLIFPCVVLLFLIPLVLFNFNLYSFFPPLAESFKCFCCSNDPFSQKGSLKFHLNLCERPLWSRMWVLLKFLENNKVRITNKKWLTVVGLGFLTDRTLLSLIGLVFKLIPLCIKKKNTKDLYCCNCFKRKLDPNAKPHAGA